MLNSPCILQGLLAAILAWGALATVELLPRGEYGVQLNPAWSELHNVIVARGEADLAESGAALVPRIPQAGWKLQKRTSAGSSAATELRNVLLGRQTSTCSSGYSLCRCESLDFNTNLILGA